MTVPENDRAELGYGKAWAKLPAKRVAEVISLILAVGVLLLAYIVHVHAERDSKNQADIIEVKSSQRILIEAVKDMIRVQKASLAEQREQTCLQRLDAKVVPDRNDICRRVSGKPRDSD
jgi:hypothetical protein